MGREDGGELHKGSGGSWRCAIQYKQLQQHIKEREKDTNFEDKKLGHWPPTGRISQ